MKLQAHETRLVGGWLDTARGVVSDEVSERVDVLASTYLNHGAAGTPWKRIECMNG